MNKEELIEIAEQVYGKCDWHGDALNHLEQLAKLVAEKEREAVANWLMRKGFATGHGDTIVDMLDELEWQIAEHEREACAKIAENRMLDDKNENMKKGYFFAQESIAKDIRARGQA
jgi:hypothetical protein